MPHQKPKTHSAWQLAAVVAACIFVAEVLVDYFLGVFNDRITSSMVEAAVLSLVVALPLYFFAYRHLNGTIRRISESEEERKLSEERLMTLIDAMPDAVYFKGGDGRWLVVNRAGLRLFGLEENDYRGKRDSELVPPENFHYPALCYCEETDKKAWEVGAPSFVEEKIPQPDGRLLCFDVIKAPIFHPDGSRKGLVVLGRDMTAIKAAERDQQRLAEAVEQAAEAVFILDDDANIIYVNDALQKSTGYAREELLGNHPRMLRSGRHPEEYYKMMLDTARTGSMWQGNLVNRRKDGTLYEVAVTLSAIADPADPAKVNFVSVQRDVTQETMLKNARNYFTMVASHELMTPLTKLQLIKVLLGNLRPGMPDDEPLDEALEALDEVYAEFERIIEATTLLSLLNSAPTADSFRNFPLHYHLLSTINRTIKRMEGEKRVIRLNLDLEQLPREAEVRGNPPVIEAALHEVLSNAIKYTPDEGAITIWAGIDGDSALIRISDEGIGIPSDKVALAFEPFYSLENPVHHSTGQYKFKGGGLGIGLTIALLAFEYHGGGIILESQGENLGTAAHLRLPLAGNG